ncbi:hypothetical protein BC832DRAFT_434271 [Gaertneriomyces semiglobifer]|nr:hypothetical protein BC832DRAFT_434271 [Gaertneriomyces semiglobifer]
MQSLPPIQSLAAIVPSSGPSSLGLGQGPQFEQSTSASYGHARSRSLDVKDGSGKATGKRSPLANEFMPNDKGERFWRDTVMRRGPSSPPTTPATESQSSSSSAPPNQAFYGSAYPNQRFGMHVNSSMQAPLPTSSPAQQPVPIAPTPVQPAERERKNSKALNKTTAPTIAKKSQREAGSTSSSRANARRRSSTSALGATPASGRRRKRSNTDSQGSSDESMKEANGEQQSNATSASKSTKTYKCETCGKVYKHPNCLLKHKWEHTEHWKEAAKFSLSKHQQVQLLEAASILVGFGLGTVGGRRPSVFEVAGIEPLKLEEVEEFNKGGEDEETREDGTRVPVEA